MQRYEKKCTFANIPAEKLHVCAFFSSRVAYGLARICGYATKKESLFGIRGEAKIRSCPRVLSRIPPIMNQKRIGNESGTEAKRIGYPARFGSCFGVPYFRQAPNNQGTTKYARSEGLAEQL